MESGAVLLLKSARHLFRRGSAPGIIAARRAHDAVAIHFDADLHVIDTNLLPSGGVHR